MHVLAACRTSALLAYAFPRTTRVICSAAGEEPIGSALAAVRTRVLSAAQAAGRPEASPPRLVAVSKTKPIELLRAAYDAGQRDFGENYVQELISKAPEMPEDVAWRFIGKLQSNKAKPLVHGVPSLAAVETVDTVKLANRLQAAMQTATPARTKPLDVFVQVNTSPWEGSKGGVVVEEVPELAAHILSACPQLKLRGLMTIGAPNDASCFQTLRSCRDDVAKAIDVPASTLELSMGMSGDFEVAIAAGSDSVRVGSSIFGARDYSPKA